MYDHRRKVLTQWAVLMVLLGGGVIASSVGGLPARVDAGLKIGAATGVILWAAWCLWPVATLIWKLPKRLSQLSSRLLSLGSDAKWR